VSDPGSERLFAALYEYNDNQGWLLARVNDVKAIESEARAAALREVAERIDGWRAMTSRDERYDLGWNDAISSVRAILTEATGASE